MTTHFQRAFAAICIVTSASFASEVVDKIATPQLTNCAAFFGLLSQANTDRSEQFKSLAFLFSSYSVEIASPSDVEVEVAKSRTLVRDLFTNAKETGNQNEVNNQFGTCMNVLRLAEKTLRPKMSDLNKSLVPQLFK